MVQTHPEGKSVHFITIGISQEHIFPVLEKYHPDHIILISSRELEEQTERLAQELRNEHSIEVDVEFLSPFIPNALTSMIFQLNDIYHQVLSRYQEETITLYAGVTGGTNLMVLAAGFFAIRHNILIHYVLNPAFVKVSDESSTPSIIEIDPNEFPKILNLQKT